MRGLPKRGLILGMAIVAVAAAASAAAYAFDGPARAGSSRIEVQGAIGGQGATGLTGPTGFGGPTGSTGPIAPSSSIGASGPAQPIDPATALYEDGPTGATGPTSTPIGAAGATSLADAREALGATLVLPDLPSVDESSIDKVVKDCGEMPRDSGCDIGIGFVAKGIWIYYQPAAQWGDSSDPLGEYQRLRSYDSSGRIVYLSGTPAYIGEGGTDAQVLIDGVRIRIWTDGVAPPDPTLQAIAQSIVDRSKVAPRAPGSGG